MTVKLSADILFLCLPVTVLVGLILQVVALTSSSWVTVDRYVVTYWNPVHKKLYRDDDHMPLGTGAAHRWEQLATAGVWSVCYSFPHFPDNHTAPYCAQFSEDSHQDIWLLTIQVLSTLSPTLSALGLVMCVLAPLFGCCCGSGRLVWMARRLLAWSGLLGLVAVTYYHVMMSKEFLVYYDTGRYEMFKCWGFHAYLDGALIHLMVCLIYKTNEKNLNTIQKI
ncbi:uncharacterized protein LOC131954732 isoform X1 [Physella acuta]|uniref:uncharacterized protein LOC131954732 isoform X1 n=1 Tax=Physella acuta TaxID=109671 RepID=UPI0027DCEC09|nr:uncharacterized protein LOC131954732 isoform X1 [Physella acuta]